VVMLEQDFIQGVFKQAAIREEQVLVSVLSEYLKEEIITSEHIKHVTCLYRHGENDRYILMYDSVQLGTVHV
jgi:hypothetical protein